MNTQKRLQTPDQEKPQRRKQQAKDRAEQIREDEDSLPVNPYPLNQESVRSGAAVSQAPSGDHEKSGSEKP